MNDSIGLSQDAVDLIRTHPADGSGMIAIYRAVFSSEYNDETYDSGLLDIFQLISDESDHIILENFGKFNSIYRSSKSLIAEGCKDEIEKIYNFYLLQFERALLDFRKNLTFEYLMNFSLYGFLCYLYHHYILFLPILPSHGSILRYPGNHLPIRPNGNEAGARQIGRSVD